MTIKIAAPVVLEFEESDKSICEGANFRDAKGIVYLVSMTTNGATKFRGFLSHADKNIFGGQTANMCFEMYSNTGNHIETTTFSGKDINDAASKVLEFLLTVSDEYK